jgi:alpha-L-arabinofuranosidase
MRLFGICSKLLLGGSLCLSATVLAQESQPPATLEINLEHPVAKVSPMLYGLMTEEINYSYDGGLYAELVRNRAVQAGRGELAHWFLTQYGNSRAAMQVDPSTGPSANRQVSLKLTVSQADPQNRAGVENEGYWGIPTLPNTTYQGTFFAKADSESLGPVTMTIVSDDTGKALATAISPALTSDW